MKRWARWPSAGPAPAPTWALPGRADREAPSFRGIEILTVSMGKISERWGEWDGMDLLRQLGIWKG